MYTIYPSEIRKSKSGALRIKIVETLHRLDIGDAFDVPIEDYKGEHKNFQHIVCAIIGKSRKKDRKFTTTWDKFKDIITITRIV